MFDSIRKARRNRKIESHFGEFSRTFTQRQKISVLKSLWMIALMDGEFHRNEKLFIEQTAEVLNYKLSDTNVLKLNDIDTNETACEIKMMDQSQQDWFVITCLMMVHVDGKALNEEYALLDSLFALIGISLERVNSIIGKHKAICDDFGIDTGIGI
ncbi:TerB family tellurite resistance protein [Maribellus maritimus]|uniref:TerB family tellurite resistance protein n=1 Tax=Maribellus maritimus TaxID=2870838 RepID=UPI001EEA9D7D|nr:TerB family tellurite resistance protein [Maribellus maritimus]